MKYHVLVDPKTTIVNKIINYKVLKHSNLLNAKQEAIDIFNKITAHDVYIAVTNDEELIDSFHHGYGLDEELYDSDSYSVDFVIRSEHIFYEYFLEFFPTNTEVKIIMDGYNNNPNKLAKQLNISKHRIDGIVDKLENHHLDLNHIDNINFIRCCLKKSNFLIKNKNTSAILKNARRLEDMFYVKIPKK